MTTTIKEIAELAGITVETLLGKIRSRFGEEVDGVYDWTPETQPRDEVVDGLIDWLGLSEQRDELATIGSSAITHADEAVVVAAMKLTEALKVNLSETANLQIDQVAAIGSATGIASAIKFQQSVLTSFQEVTDVFSDESEQVVLEQLGEIESRIVELAKDAETYLGKSVRRRQQMQDVSKRLKERVSSLSQGLFKNPSKKI